MAANSRSYIMARRGTGIADLKDVTLENGDMDIKQAENIGVYRVNCTHQVGIATASEVGLPASRYPIRVVICANAAAFEDPRTQTAVSYWALLKSNGETINYSRKPLPADSRIRNLYKYVKDFDEILWTTFSAQRKQTLDRTHSAELDELNVHLYNILGLVNPTDEQISSVGTSVRTIMDTAFAQKRLAYVKVADDAFIVADPVGTPYEKIGDLTPNRLALHEAAVCMNINYKRLKKSYDTVPDGNISLAAYSIAAMFRHGLAECYEHREYHTAVFVPTPGKNDSYDLARIVPPKGSDPPADLSEGMQVDVSKMKLKAQLVELGNLMVVASGLMHYLFNHTTGGTVITGVLLTVMSMYQLIDRSMTLDQQTTITSLMYEALHPTNKRAIANIFFKNAKVTTHGKCPRFVRYERLCLDSFTQIRANPYPAGSHKAFIVLQALRRVVASGLAPFLPWAEQMNSCIDACKSVLSNGARSHIGSAYYTGEPPLTQPAQLDHYLPELASYIHTFNRGDSLSMSPHMSEEHAKRAAMNWQNLMKDLKAKDVSATPTEVVRQFLSTSGAVHFAFDPDDQSTWAKAVGDARVAGDAIDAIFA